MIGIKIVKSTHQLLLQYGSTRFLYHLQISLFTVLLNRITQHNQRGQQTWYARNQNHRPTNIRSVCNCQVSRPFHVGRSSRHHVNPNPTRKFIQQTIYSKNKSSLLPLATYHIRNKVNPCWKNQWLRSTLIVTKLPIGKAKIYMIQLFDRVRKNIMARQMVQITLPR